MTQAVHSSQSLASSDIPHSSSPETTGLKRDFDNHLYQHIVHCAPVYCLNTGWHREAVKSRVQPNRIAASKFLAIIVRHIGRWRSPVPHPSSTPHLPLLWALEMPDRDPAAFLPCDPDHEIVVVPATGHPDRQALWDQCLRVRIDVFVHEQGFPLGVETDQYDPIATHFLLRSLPSLLPIGTIRAVKVIGQGGSQDHIYYKLGRLAVIKSYRDRRFGRDLVLALHKWVKEATKRSYDHLEVAKVVAHSQIPVKPFYCKYGYQPEGDEFDEDGAPHQKMVAYLSLQN
ncbi:hypothetical protein SCLCIDRAFT_1209155 [Scleroderma citrinum Foug A]|uniref:N-acetyltransferase domain-containing protein n=1 Tax=Scleroderma citrinum Foug A TaxID=1036808 RepID=A0A0C3EL48_9AGAM|nr:hypothetical protein SCLCIDRAFT_1209155 [Scleroderma citrinum Foug A]